MDIEKKAKHAALDDLLHYAKKEQAKQLLSKHISRDPEEPDEGMDSGEEEDDESKEDPKEEATETPEEEQAEEDDEDGGKEQKKKFDLEALRKMSAAKKKG